MKVSGIAVVCPQANRWPQARRFQTPSRAAAISPRSGDTDGARDVAGTYTKLYYHIVFSTKHRAAAITPAIEDDLHRYLGGIVRGIGGVCVEINGMSDHVHILAILPPKIAVSDALREIKASSSKWVHESKPNLARFAWQDGYAAFTVSRSQLDSTVAYIRDQKTHHAQRDFQAEFLALLEKHQVEFDPRYVWD